MSRLEFLRKGIPEHKITVIPNSTEKIAIVALNNKEILKARENTLKYLDEFNLDTAGQELILKMFILKECLRLPDDLNTNYVESFEEINIYMDPYIVYNLYGTYVEVQSNSVPEFQDLTLEEFEDIKKKLKMTNLNELDGELQTILKHFHHQMNLKSLLQDK